MRRRQYLAVTAASTATVGLAGCSDETGGNNSSNGSGGGETEADSTETGAEAGGEDTTAASTDTEAVETTASATDASTETNAGIETEAGTETPAEETMMETETEAGEETTTAEETTMAAETETDADTTAASSGGGFSETFSGSGTSTVEGLELSSGPILAEYSHNGSGNFIVTLITLEGESYEDVYLANSIGQAEGFQAAAVSAAGGYNLNVEADGDWEIAVEQPANPQPQSLPIDASGTGPSYIGPFEFSGPTTFQASHSGESNFIVSSVPVDPSAMGSPGIFNEIGQFEGETTARVNGLVYLNIQADGEWSLSTG